MNGVDVLLVVSYTVCVVWSWSAALTGRAFFGTFLPPRIGRNALLLWVAQELRPFYLPAFMITEAHEIATRPQTWWEWVLRVWAVMFWFYADKDDGRWQRRRRKVRDRVRVHAGRLVVVRAGGEL